CKRLEKKIPRGFAIMICLFIIIGIISGFLILFYSQIAILTSDLPLFKAKAAEIIRQIQSIIESHFHVSAADQTKWLQTNSSKAANFTGSLAQSFLLSLTGGFADLILVIIYFIFFLLLRERFKKFLLSIFKIEGHEKIIIIISKTQNLTRHYIAGLIIVVFLLGTMNAIGFLALGIKQAIFLGYLRGLLNIIPYVGAVIGTIFPMFSALVYNDSGAVLGVILVSVITQFIENNFLTPRIVGSNIKINALATIIVIIMGGMLWGLDGMILFLPLLGIAKIICDHVEELKPLGYLMGEDEEKKNSGIREKLKKIFQRKTEPLPHTKK
ncbi:MAG TPA: AI-2E family transporter, partial [Cytophagaceae bacterium]|nr:AI-2E family transporter [Cytophagaceae bacterium]